jgi:D-3-phosphoglycerate dehydrogenase
MSFINDATRNTRHAPLRIGSALFNADHGRLAEEVRRIEAAGVDFLHFDVFDGHFVPDLAFPPRTMATLRPLTPLPFEVHLAASDPLRFLPALKQSGANLVFLPAESSPLLYEAIFAVREQAMRVGLCLALGTSLSVLEPVLPLLDAVLLLGRVTGEGQRGRAFNDLLLDRVRAVRQMIDTRSLQIDLQAAGGLETESCRAAVAAGATSLPLGAALHRELDMGAYVAFLRAYLEGENKRTKEQANKGTNEQANKRTSEQANQEPETENQGTSEQTSTARNTQHATRNTQHFKVLVASRSFGPNCPTALDRMRAVGCELIPNEWGRAPTEDELLERIGEVDALISGTEPVTARVLAAAPRLKIIAKHGVGYENIDLEAARARGVPVALAGGASADSVADMTFALLLGLARQTPQGDRAVRAGAWPRMVGMELRGKTLGIIGLGQIGKAVCRRAKGFGLEMIAYDLYPDERFAASWGLRYLPLDEVLAGADIVTLHAPVTPETRQMINATTLARMKPGAFLINTARGELIDEQALADALRSGRLAGAACDVFTQEPPANSPLLSLDNFIAMPHSAGQTTDGLRKMGEITAENVLRALAGDEPLYRVV